MRFGPMISGDLPVGPVTTWWPCPRREDAAADPPLDPREPTPDQRRRHAERTARLPEDESAPFIAIGIRLRHADEASVAETLRRFVDRHEALRSGLVEHDGRLHRRTAGPGTLDFRPETTPAADEDEVVARALDWFRRWADTTSWPCFGAVTVRTGDITTLALAVDHIAFDGLSAYLALSELPDLHDGVLAGAPPPAAAPSHVDAAHRIAGEQADLHPAHPSLDLWRAALTRPGGPAPGAPTADSWPAATMRTGSRLVADADMLAEIGSRAAEAGARLPFVLLVALEAALAPELPGPYPYLVSTHNRRGAERTDSIGWYAGVAPYPRTDESLRLLDRASELAAGWGEVARAGALDVPLVASTVGRWPRPHVVVSLVDLTAVPGHERWAQDGASTWAGPVPPSDEVHLWLKLSATGLHLETRHLAGPERCRWLEEVVDRCRHELEQLTGWAAAGQRPDHRPEPVHA